MLCLVQYGSCFRNMLIVDHVVWVMHMGAVYL